MGKPGEPDIGHERNWASFDKTSSRRVENITTRESPCVCGAARLLLPELYSGELTFVARKGWKRKIAGQLHPRLCSRAVCSMTVTNLVLTAVTNVSRWPRFVGLTFGIVLTAGALTNTRDDSWGQRILFKTPTSCLETFLDTNSSLLYMIRKFIHLFITTPRGMTQEIIEEIKICWKYCCGIIATCCYANPVWKGIRSLSICWNMSNCHFFLHRDADRVAGDVKCINGRSV